MIVIYINCFNLATFLDSSKFVFSLLLLMKEHLTILLPKYTNLVNICWKNKQLDGAKLQHKLVPRIIFIEMYNLVSVMKNRSTTLPSGVVDTFTFFMVSSSSQRASVTSVSITKTLSYSYSNKEKDIQLPFQPMNIE